MAIKTSNWVVCALCALLFSCAPGAEVDENQAIAGNEWKINDIKTFTFTIDDTVSSYDFSVNLRHTESYPYKNIYMFMSFSLPQGSKITDSIQYILQDENSRWKGNHSGSLITHQVLVKQNRRFPLKGRYVISLRHGMYDNPLKGVSDVGITLRKRKQEE